MVQQVQEACHPIFTSTSALSRGILKRRGWKSTIHFNGDAVNTELLFQTVLSVNQISTYAAVTGWCYQFSLTKGKRTSRYFCGQWIFDHGGKRRSGNVDISSERCTWKQDASRHEFLNIGKEASLYARRTIPKNEIKWTTIHAHSRYGEVLAVTISKTVTKMCRHFDQEERECDMSRHWDSIKEVLDRTFAREGARDFSDEAWL